MTVVCEFCDVCFWGGLALGLFVGLVGGFCFCLVVLGGLGDVLVWVWGWVFVVVFWWLFVIGLILLGWVEALCVVW